MVPGGGLEPPISLTKNLLASPLVCKIGADFLDCPANGASFGGDN